MGTQYHNPETSIPLDEIESEFIIDGQRNKKNPFKPDTVEYADFEASLPEDPGLRTKNAKPHRKYKPRPTSGGQRLNHIN